MHRLAHNAGPGTGHGTPTRLRDFPTAFQAMSLALTRRHVGPRPHHPIRDGVIDLILHRPIRSPTARHHRYPMSLISPQRNIRTSNARSKDCSAHRQPQATLASPSHPLGAIPHQQRTKILGASHGRLNRPREAAVLLPRRPSVALPLLLCVNTLTYPTCNETRWASYPMTASPAPTLMQIANDATDLPGITDD